MARVVLCVQNMAVPDDPRVWREARSLAQAGHRVTVLSPAPPGTVGRRFVQDDVEVRQVRLPSIETTLGLVLETVATLVRFGFEIARIRARDRIDVVHVANPPDTLFLLTLPLRANGTKVVYDQHDLCPELLAARNGSSPLFAAVLRLLEGWSYRSAHLVVAPNGSYQRVAVERGRVPPDRVVVVRNGPDAISPALSVSKAKPAVIAFAGVMGFQDGADVLIRAVADVLNRRPESVTLELIGRGSAVPALKAEVQALGIVDSVRWAGWLTPDEMRARLSQATIAASVDVETPFTRCSTMIKVGDYLALGLPSIVSDLPENRVTAEDAVLYFRPGDQDELAKRIEELLDDADLREVLSRRARERAKSLLWERSGRALVDAYERMLSPEA